MKNKNYKLEFGKKEKIMLFLFIALFSITTVLAFFRLVGLFDLKSYFVFLDVMGILFSLFICLFISFTLFKSKYIFEEKNLIEKIAFWNTKIPYENIVNAIFSQSKNSLFIFYNKKNKQTFLKINVNKSKIDDFIKDLKEKNNKILYEIYSGE